MNKNILLFIVMSILVILSVSSAYSSEISDDSIDTGDDIAINDATQQATVQSEVQTSTDNNVESNKNIKQDFTQVSVDSYASMITEINNAQSASTPVVISLNPGNYNATESFTFNGGSNKNLTINGNGLTLDGNGKYKFAQIRANNYLTLKDITLQNYNSAGPGGTIYCLGQINIDNATFINNTASSSTGGVLTVQDFSGKHSTIDNSLFISNKASSGSGGAISVNYATLTINNTKFINNTCNGITSYGGAIYNMGTLTIENSTFEHNGNTNIGGAIGTDNKLTIVNTTFNDNYAHRYGGAINYGNNPLNIYNSSFDNNTANRGGALYAGSGALVADNITFTSNNADEGGVLVTSGSTSISASVFENNKATSAAAIKANNSIISLTNNTFRFNKADDETLILDNPNIILKDNIYEYTTISYDEFELVSDTDSVDFGDEIGLEVISVLSNPQYYDEDILSRNTWLTFVNDENTYNSTESTYTITAQDTGEVEIFVFSLISANITNTVNVMVNQKVALVVNPITASIGDVISITAQIEINDEVYEDLSMGKVSFKVNGKTLKDSDNKVIYVKVVNGVATIDDFEVPESWSNDSTIQAVYSGSSKCEKLTSEKSEINIIAPEAAITTEDIQASAGSSITLTATVTDAGNVINIGKVVFKINGKTVKDETGKVIYAKITDNQVSVEYTIPDTYKAGTYSLTAIFISPDYDRLEDTKVLTII